MSQDIPAVVSPSKWPVRQLVVTAISRGWVYSNGIALVAACLVYLFSPEDSLRGMALGYSITMLVWTLGLVPLIPFLVVYYPLTRLLRDRWGGWERTQLSVTIIALAGGFVLLVLLLYWDTSSYYIGGLLDLWYR